MSSPDSLQSGDPFQCSICLDVFKDPVTIPCGHTYCSSCITTHWDGKYVYHCPLCQETFNKRPELKVNIAFREALKSEMKAREIRNAERQEPPVPVPAPARDGVFTPVTVMSFVVCLVGVVCVMNLQAPLDQAPPTPLGEWGKEKPNKFRDEMKEEIQERQRNLRDIKISAELSKTNTLGERLVNLQFIHDLRSVLKKGLVELDQMEKEQKAAEKMADEHIEELQQEITDLQKKSEEMEKLSPIEDYQHILHLLQSECLPSKNWLEISFYKGLSFIGPVRRFSSGLVEQLQEKNKEASGVELKEMHQYHVDVTLDPDTAHPRLILSEDGKQVKEGDRRQNLPDNPKRFDPVACVLGREGFSSGRFYYEVQVKDKTRWDLGVARESINRKRNIITLSPDDGYWTVWLRDGEYKALAYPSVLLSLSPPPQKVGVFVDYEGGQVSFYDVDNRSHIYSFTGQTFTETLYPYFSPETNEDGKNSAPLIITHPEYSYQFYYRHFMEIVQYESRID